MKLYCVRNVDDPDHGTTQTWTGSQAEARRVMADMIEAGQDVEGISIKRVDIPTDKAGLIRWLNLHFATDNG